MQKVEQKSCEISRKSTLPHPPQKSQTENQIKQKKLLQTKKPPKTKTTPRKAVFLGFMALLTHLVILNPWLARFVTVDLLF